MDKISGLKEKNTWQVVLQGSASMESQNKKISDVRGTVDEASAGKPRPGQTTEAPWKSLLTPPSCFLRTEPTMAGIHPPKPIEIYYLDIASQINRSAQFGVKSSTGPRPFDGGFADDWKKSVSHARLMYGAVSVTNFLQGIYDPSEFPSDLYGFQERLAGAINVWNLNEYVFLIRPEILKTSSPLEWPNTLRELSGPLGQYSAINDLNLETEHGT